MMAGRDGELLSLHVNKVGPCYKSREQLYLRNIKVSDTDFLCSRWAILPNVNGQKYTFGSIYKSRDDQGEFIFWSKEPDPANEKSVCEINVEENKYFVTPTPQGPPVYINCAKVTERMEMKFGDTLYLGESTDFFIFNERELSPEVFIDSMETWAKSNGKKMTENARKKKKNGFKNAKPILGDFIPGQNELIMSHILSFLPTYEVKNARLVSKLWNEEGFKILRKRCTISLDFVDDDDGTQESMSLFRYSLEMRHRPMWNWSIKLPSLETDDTLQGSREAKIIDDLESYIINQDKATIRYVKRLEVGGTIRSQVDYDYRVSLVRALGKNLEELIWSGEIWHQERASGKDYSFPENIGWNKLRIFTLSLTPLMWSGSMDGAIHRASTTDCSTLTWLQHIIKSIQGVEAIRLQGGTPLMVTFLNHFQGNDAWSPFINLSEINIPRLTPIGIKILLKLNKSLKKLHLHHLYDLDVLDFPAFDELLAKHAKSLQSLWFVVPPNPVQDSILAPMSINFPPFPNLEVLQIGAWGPGGYFRTRNIEFKFPSRDEIINYFSTVKISHSLGNRIYGVPSRRGTGFRETSLSSTGLGPLP